MSKVMLGKYFNRREDWDFSDDGTRFRCYEIDGNEISYAKTNCGIFLCAHLYNMFDKDIVDLDEGYFKLYREANEIADRYNDGCNDISDDQLCAWKNDLEYIIEKIKNFHHEKPTIYYNPLDRQYYAMTYHKEYAWNDLTTKFEKAYVRDERKYNIKYLKVVDNLD